MSAHGRVAKSFWTRSARQWSDDEKLLALYLLTGPHHTLERFYRLPVGYVVDDLGWPAARVRKVMGSLEACEFAAYDRDAQVVLVVKGLAYQAPKGDKQITGALRVLAEVPPTPLLGRFLEAAEEHAADAIGMSGLLVKSTVIMKDNLAEMNTRGIAEKFPVILGGAAMTRAYVEQDLAEMFDGEVRYARDAFEGLSLMDAIMAVKRGDPGAELPALRERRVRATGSRAALPEVEVPARSDVAADAPRQADGLLQ